MKDKTNLEESLQDFIEERIQHSYSIAKDKRSYKEQYSRYKELETKFINNMQNKNILDIYYNFKTIKMDLEMEELKEAYLIGFRDGIKIYNNI